MRQSREPEPESTILSGVALLNLSRVGDRSDGGDALAGGLKLL
jgi:hypothetical protein